MTPFSTLHGVAAPLPLVNVDTDKILPAQFLKTISREGLGEGLFFSLRQDTDFVLNRAPWNQAQILVALDNFGCGSSREHAPWALLDFGFRCIVAPSFADIFYNNCFKNGILPVVLPPEAVDELMRLAADPAGAPFDVDLEAQQLTAGERAYAFSLRPAQKQALLLGLDEVASSLAHEDEILAYEDARAKRQPWLPKLPTSFAA